MPSCSGNWVRGAGALCRTNVGSGSACNPTMLAVGRLRLLYRVPYVKFRSCTGRRPCEGASDGCVGASRMAAQLASPHSCFF